MILIMSSRYDHSTYKVCKWLTLLGSNFVRIHGDDNSKIEMLKVGTNLELKVNQKKLNLSEISSVWYRRGRFVGNFQIKDADKLLGVITYIKGHLQAELSVLSDYFYLKLEQKPHIGKYRTKSVNKLIVLEAALELEIATPETIVTTSNSDYFSHCDLIRPMITKSLSEPFTPKTPYGDYITYTEGVNLKMIGEASFPSLFQTKIEKEADIRSFYLNGKFYSMAIRSQDNEQTQTDFRKYLKVNRNRRFPFKLPDELEQKLHLLMQRMELETGSIDLVMTRGGEFIFLEVNPVGQFGMTSIPCNYMLEKEIAVTLQKLASNERQPEKLP